MSDAKLTQEDVQKILRMIEATEGVTEFHLRFGDIEIGLSRANGTLGTGSGPVPKPKAQVAVPKAAAPGQAAAVGTGSEPVPKGMTAIKAPMVGTFYRAPAPGAPPFVEVGDRVEPDSILCIIEVMKLMNSIPAGIRGTVREIRVNDAEAVEYGQVLVVIEPAR